MRKYAVGFISIFAVLIWLFIFNSPVTSPTANLSVTAPNTDLSKTEENMPLEDMTIPYLRSREYSSSLGEREVYRQQGTYTSYLTSYDSDGLKINGLLTIPNGTPPKNGWPAIVFVHGYIAPSIYETTEKYVEYVDYLARNDFVVFKIDLRGHGDSEGVSRGAYYSPDYVIDTLNARAALASSDFVDPDSIGLWGHSMAGNVTFRSFVASQNIPALVVWSGAGFTYDDLSDYGIDDNSYRPPPSVSERRRYREMLRDLYGRYDANNEFWMKVTPVNYLNGVKGAVQLHHAKNDTVVNIEYSRNLRNILNEARIPNELNEYDTGGHNIASPAFSNAMSSTVDFFKTYLSE